MECNPKQRVNTKLFKTLERLIIIILHYFRRLQSRKSCIDLQTLVIQIPKSKSDQITAKNTRITEKTNYPISLVPGQFSEFFKSYSPEELALVFHNKLSIFKFINASHSTGAIQ